MAFLEIRRENIAENTQKVLSLASREGMGLSVVTKFCLSDAFMLDLLAENGISSIAEANMASFSRAECSRLNLKTGVIKTRLSDINTIHGGGFVPYVLYVSDEVLLRAVAALPGNKKPRVFLIAEIGDFRDGFYLDDMRGVLERNPNANICGISANFGCLSGKMPTIEQIAEIRRTADDLRLSEVSIGGTVVYALLKSGAFKGLATQVRMGEALFFGYDSSSGTPLEGLKRGAFTLYGEILEIREKDVVPPSGGGLNAFGGSPAPRPYGRRRCAVMDFGALVSLSGDLVPLDPDVVFCGQTYDFTVADITNSTESYYTGGFMPFCAEYAACARAFMNPFVEKHYV